MDSFSFFQVEKEFTQEVIGKLADKELDKFNKLSDKKQEDVLLNMEKDAEKIFKKRNLFNEIGH